MNKYYGDRITFQSGLPYPSVLQGVKAVEVAQKEANTEIEQQVSNGDTSGVTAWLDKVKTTLSKTTNGETKSSIVDTAVNLYTKITKIADTVSEEKRKKEIDSYLLALSQLIDEMDNELEETRTHKWLLFGGVNAACVIVGIVMYNIFKK